MNVQTRVSERLWTAIERSWEGGNYSAAILDSVFLLAEVIRERTGLESDGVSLVGQAFGGKSPKLKVNNMLTESDRNIQKGVEQLFRGLFQAIRNPRSHQKYDDTKDTAQAIILFCNYLLGIVDKSRSPFSKKLFLERVFDPDFVEDERYADLLVDEIPERHLFEVCVDVFKQKTDGDADKLACFFKSLLQRLSETDKLEFLSLVSDELRVANDKVTISSIIRMMPAECWCFYDEVARLRIENKIVNSVSDGRFNYHTGKCSSGAFGTWGTGLVEHFELKEELYYTLIAVLTSEDFLAVSYVTRYYLKYLPELTDDPQERAIRIVNEALKNGDKRFYDPLWYWRRFHPNWFQQVSEAHDNFVETQQPSAQDDDDDLPF